MASVNGDDLSRRLIDESARMFAEQGPAGLSLRKLAAAVGTSTMSVHTLFGDKRGLLHAMHREGFGRLGERLQQTVQSNDPLTEIGRAYRLAALDSPHLYGLMFGPLPIDFEPATATTKRPPRPTHHWSMACVRRSRAATWPGTLSKLPFHVWVVAHEMVSLELSGHISTSPDDAERLYDQALLLAAQPFMSSD